MVAPVNPYRQHQLRQGSVRDVCDAVISIASVYPELAPGIRILVNELARQVTALIESEA